MLLRSPVLTWFRSLVEGLFLSDVDTFDALSLDAADWFPPLIDLSDVRVPDEVLS
jgi:hypothetical protein